MRQKLIKDTLKTLGDLVSLMLEDEKILILKKIEKMAHDMVKDDDELEKIEKERKRWGIGADDHIQTFLLNPKH